MDESNSVQSVTEENLAMLQFIQAQKTPTASLATSDDLPIDALDRAKVLIYRFLWRLRTYGAEGDRIRDEVDVYLDEKRVVHYRGNSVPAPDLEDSNFWEAKVLYLEQKYGRHLKLRQERRLIYHTMKRLRDLGTDGQKVLDECELDFAGTEDVRYRGGDPEPDLEDLTYWRAQYKFLSSKYDVLYETPYPPTEMSAEYFVDLASLPPSPRRVLREDNPEDLKWIWAKMKRDIRAWVDGLHGEVSSSGPRGPILHYPSENTAANISEDTNSYQFEEYFRWHEAYRGVYERMAALWKLGGEARETVKNDELRIMGRHDVRYRRSRGPKPDLKNPTYWEAKWEYFTGKYISFLRDMQDSSKVLEELALYPYEIPVPSAASSVLSPTSSSVSSLQPTAESIRVQKVKEAKEHLYLLLTTDFFQNEGRKILDDDDVYVSGLGEVRYRHTVGPEPNLRDPQFWLEKINYFLSSHHASFPDGALVSSGPYTRPPISQGWTSRYLERSSNESTIRTILGQQRDPTVPVTDPADKENCAPCSGLATTQPMQLPSAPKRKRAGFLDDTDEVEDQLSRRIKRGRLEAGQASTAGATVMGSSSGAAPLPKTSTGDAIVRQPRASRRALNHGVGQSSTMAPIVIEGPETRATQTPPQRRKRQRKTYEKERTSRRLAGQSPEFGLLPERGEEPQPYESLSRRAANTGETKGLKTRSGRISKKPAAAKSTSSRATPKPAEERASCQRRTKRN